MSEMAWAAALLKAVSLLSSSLCSYDLKNSLLAHLAHQFISMSEEGVRLHG